MNQETVKNTVLREVTISVDLGNKNTKSDNFIFVSGCTKDTSALSIGEADRSICYNGSYYSLSRERLPYTYDKSTDDRFYGLVLFAIAQELEKKINEGMSYKPEDVFGINLVTSLPPMHVDALKDRIRKWLLKDGKTQTFTYRSRTYRIVIKDVYVAMQGYAAVLANTDKLLPAIRASKKRQVVVLDIGGFTVDVLSMTPELKGIDKSKLASYELGIITLYNEIARRINAKTGAKYTEDDIDAYLNGDTGEDAEIAEIMDSCAADYIVKLENQFRERGIDLSRTFLIFAGGASITLKKYILAGRQFGKNAPYVVNDPQANVIGARKEYGFYCRYIKNRKG